MSTAAASPARRFVEYDKFLDCVHCGLCLTACPTYRELGTEMDSPRGRIYLMKALEEGAIEMTSDVARHLDLCLGCRACETAAPQYAPLDLTPVRLPSKGAAGVVPAAVNRHVADGGEEPYTFLATTYQ